MNSKKFFAEILVTIALALLLSSPALIAQDTQEGGKFRQMSIKVSQYTKRPPVNDETIAAGRRIYELACISCHGVEGNGRGPVTYFLSRDTGPHPRDFTLEPYKFRSTMSGEIPMDEDLFLTITRGITGFMPPFAGLDPADRWKVIYYIKSLAPEDFASGPPEPIRVVGKPVPITAMSIQRGYQLYQEGGCWECHGGGGKGNGEKAYELKDDRELPLPPTDLTMPSSFKAGYQPEDIYRTILTGLDGGAMPSHERFMGQEEVVWDLVNYIRSLSAE